MADIKSALRNARAFVQSDRDLMAECHSIIGADGQPKPGTMEEAAAAELASTHDQLLAELDAAIAVLDGDTAAMRRLREVYEAVTWARNSGFGAVTLAQIDALTDAIAELEQRRAIATGEAPEILP